MTGPDPAREAAAEPRVAAAPPASPTPPATAPRPTVARPEPASLGRAFVALLAMELRLTARRSENLLVMFGVPPILLVFLATVPFRGGGSGAPGVAPLLGPIVAIAIAAAGFVNLGIATAYERAYGVLKRLGGSPLPVGVLVAAKVVAVGIVVVGQLVVLAVVALGLGWRPTPAASVPLLVAGCGLGLLAFASLGLLFGGTLRAEAALAVINGLFLVLLLLGGVLVPVAALPDGLRNLAELAPVTALARVVEAALASGAAGAGGAGGPAGGGAGAPAGGTAVPVDVGGELLALTAWAVGASIAAWRAFCWE